MNLNRHHQIARKILGDTLLDLNECSELAQLRVERSNRNHATFISLSEAGPAVLHVNPLPNLSVNLRNDGACVWVGSNCSPTWCLSNMDAGSSRLWATAYGAPKLHRSATGRANTGRVAWAETRSRIRAPHASGNTPAVCGEAEPAPNLWEQYSERRIIHGNGCSSSRVFGWWTPRNPESLFALTLRDNPVVKPGARRLSRCRVQRISHRVLAGDDRRACRRDRHFGRPRERRLFSTPLHC